MVRKISISNGLVNRSPSAAFTGRVKVSSNADPFCAMAKSEIRSGCSMRGGRGGPDTPQARNNPQLAYNKKDRYARRFPWPETPCDVVGEICGLFLACGVSGPPRPPRIEQPERI